MFVLVVTRRAATGELVRQTLGAEGWWVTAVADRETAVRSASDQAPQLVIIDGAVDEAAELVRFFAARHGGPGALLLAAAAAAEGAADQGDAAAAAAAAAENEADAVLPGEPSAEELAATAGRLLEQPQASPASGLPTPGQVLNAQDIFGDMLLEMEGEDSALADPPPPPAPVPVPAETATVDPPAPAPAPAPAMAMAPVSLPPPVTQLGELVDTRPMVIPEPTLDSDDDDLRFGFPAVPALGVGGEGDECEPGAATGTDIDIGIGIDIDTDADQETATPVAAVAASAGVAYIGDDEADDETTKELEPVRLARPVAAEVPSPAEPAPGSDPEPPSEDAANAPAEIAAPVRSIWRRGGLPGGTRFWLGMAAGLLVFVSASFLLDRYFSSAPEPAAVAVPAAGAVDLEELVDQELAEREDELRESLLEEERRLQRQLDELNEDGDG